MNSPSKPKLIVQVTLITFLACLFLGCRSDEAIICKAARNGNAKQVEELLNKGVNVNAQDKWFANLTPLHWAARRGDKGLSTLLLERGANIEARDFNGKTPLHWAASEGNVETVRFLVVKGANVNAIDDGGGTPVWAAVFADKKDIGQFLVEHGAILPPPESQKNKSAWSAWNWKNSPMLNETARKSQEAQSGGRKRIPGPLVVLFVFGFAAGIVYGICAAFRPYLRRRL
jgi:ankyrin repeat protein